MRRLMISKIRKAPVALVNLVALLIFLLACAGDETTTDTPRATSGALPVAGEGGVPASVTKLTVAVDGWGAAEDLNPVHNLQVNFLRDYVNLFLLMRDEDHNIVPGLVTEWSFSDEGFQGTIHENAKWHDGSDVTADDIKWNFEALRGDFAPEIKGHYGQSKFQGQIGNIEVIDSKRFLVRTLQPTADFIQQYTGTGYHFVHFGPPRYIQEVGADAYEDKPSGGGPYEVDEYKVGERIVFERWDDFWSDSPWYHKPQHETLEILLAKDPASRFALLESKQVDMIVNIPYGVAKDLPDSEDFGRRGVNPNQGDLWVQVIKGTGAMNLQFANLMAIKDSRDPPTPEEVKPFDDARVREAMELALDKRAMSEKAHFGFTEPMGGLWFRGSFGYRELPVSPYDLDKAKQLMKDAGYPDGFSTQVFYGPFVNSPGIAEWLESAASQWRELGIELDIFDIPASEFYPFLGRPLPPDRVRKWRPLAVQTFGRQEHGVTIAGNAYCETCFFQCCWTERTNELVAQITATTDEATLKQGLAGIEDDILKERLLIPMVEVGVVQGYTDRVLAHPTAPHASSFEQLWRIVLRD